MLTNRQGYEIPLCEMLKEVRDDFDSIANIARSATISADTLDKELYKIYDYISKVIPCCRSVVSDGSPMVVSVDDYLTLLNDFEYVYDKVKELL